MAQELEEGDLVLCTVEKTVGTIVFVKIHLNGEEKEGSIILSEVAPGRIRNLRDYVVPKKKIVCKILRISGNKIDLSLRRVNQKERKEILDLYNQERSYESVLRSILKEKAEKIISEITEKERISDFFEKAKTDPKELERICEKPEAEKILEILKKEKKKNAFLKKEIKLVSNKPNGLKLIKEILGKVEKKGSEIKYISAGRYSIKKEAEDIKTADKKLREILENIEKDAKKENMEFEIKEKKK